jgi:hypothetical protein
MTAQPGSDGLSLGGLRLWPTVCLRSAGLPFGALQALAAGDLMALVDRSEPAAALERRLADHWREAVAATADADWSDTFLAALMWQNPGVATTTVRPLLTGRYRSGSAKQRYKLAALTSYLQRYAAKNDSIGFFGPVAWGGFAPIGETVRWEPGAEVIAESRVFLEDWAAHELRRAGGTARRRPLLAPHVRPEIDHLRLPMGATIAVDRAAASVLRLCTGARTTAEIAAELAAPLDRPSAVEAVIAEFASRGLVGYAVDDDLDTAAAGCAQRLRGLADVARSPAELADGLAELDQVFEAATGATARRSRGDAATGRTVARIESRRAVRLTVATRVLADLDPPMTVLLHVARWLVQQSVERILSALRSTITRSGAASVPLVDLWLAHADLWFALQPRFLAAVIAELRQRWARSLPVPAGQRAAALDCAEALAAVRQHFPLQAWPDSQVEAYACPDLLIGLPDGDPAGQPGYVLGELHLGRNTLATSLFSACGDIGPELDRQWRADGGQLVSLSVSHTAGGTRMRSRFAPLTGHEVATSLLSPLRPGSLRLADFDVSADPGGGLTARHVAGAATVPLPALLSDAIAVSLSNLFQPFAPARHQPRVSLGPLVVARESWTLTGTEAHRLRAARGAGRLVEVRRLVRDLDLPRFLFARSEPGAKPFLVDALSPASVDLLVRQLRRTAAPCVLTEMLPAPSALWLTDRAGHVYTSELRLAVDLFPAGPSRAG